MIGLVLKLRIKERKFLTFRLELRLFINSTFFIIKNSLAYTTYLGKKADVLFA